MSEYTAFKAEVAKQKKLKGLTNSDIADMTGLSVSTISKFLAENLSIKRFDKKHVAVAIAYALNIPFDKSEVFKL